MSSHIVLAEEVRGYCAAETVIGGLAPHNRAPMAKALLARFNAPTPFARGFTLRLNDIAAAAEID